MEGIIQGHARLLAIAQKEYIESVSKQSANGVTFWLGQMQTLCEQLKLLSEAAGSTSIVTRNSISTNELQSLKEVVAATPARIIAPVKREPTSYAWDDGFEGVTLEDAWQSQ